MPFPLGHKTFFTLDYTLTTEDKAVCMRIENAEGRSFYYVRRQKHEHSPPDWTPIRPDTFHKLMRPEKETVKL